MPRLYSPAVACPKGSYPNDENFQFCQQCGYRRQTMDNQEGPLRKKLAIDEGAITQRLQDLSQKRSSSRYSKQKSALEREFVDFLASRVSPKALVSALPKDVTAFLVWKDRAGKTKVHQPACSALSCPDTVWRLASGTVDSLIGKLRAIFAENGRGSQWHSLLGVGNPAACRYVKAYLDSVREEQLKARVTPRQAEPILISDLAIISDHIEQALLGESNLSTIQIFVHARDQALFKALFFAGDRAADMLQTKVSDILRFPDNSGFLLNHVWTKSLRSGDANVFAFKRGSNKAVCPVRGLEIYFDISRFLGINLAPGFLFCSVTKSHTVSPNPLEPTAAQARLKLFSSALGSKLSNQHLTTHGFPSGAAVSLALEGISLHEIMDHVGWKNSKTALHYIKLRQVVNPAGAAARLAELPLDTGGMYRRINNLEGFSQAFSS